MTFDLAEIKELMPQQARKQLEAELGTSFCSLGGVYCLYTAVLVSPVQSSPVQSIVQSSPESRFYRDPCDFRIQVHRSEQLASVSSDT